MKRWMILTLGDWRNIRRDWLLLLTLAAPVLLLGFVRFLIPPLEDFLRERFMVSLEPFKHHIMGVLVLVPSQTIGALAGFLLLDDRDDGILTYVSVTPIAKKGYLVHRLLVSTVLCFLLTLAFVLLSGWFSAPFSGLVWTVAMASLEVPMIALFLAAFAANKVEGLALSKLTGLSFLGPLAGWLLPGSWKWTGALLPTFWVSQCYLAWAEAFPGSVWLMGAGMIDHLVLVAVFYGIFWKRAG